MNENLQHVLDKIKEVYARMELRQRLMIAILLAVTFGIIIWMISWSARTDYGLLFARLSPEEAQKAMNKLSELSVPYRIREEGQTTNIYVPAEMVHPTRINLASEKIGQTAQGVGFEIFDRTSLGVTEFVQKNVNYRRAMEGELQRTIHSINGVEFVRVHLVFPEERIFREDQQEPTASVMMRLTRRLNEKQIEGIVNLIAFAVEGLDPSRIRIVDQDGRILSDTNEDSLAGISNQQLRVQTQRENQLTMVVQSMLDQFLDVGNSVVRVSAVLNFDQVEVTSERFDPDGQVVRSEQIQLNNETSLRDSMSIVSERQITNYEISSTVQRRVAQVGDIKRLTASVNVNYKTNRRYENGREIIEYIERTPEELAQIEALVRTALGYDADRGDQIVVTNMLFDRSAQEYLLASQDREERMKQYIALAEKGAVIIVLAVLVIVLITQFRKIFAQPEEEEEEEPEELPEDTVLPAMIEGAGTEGFYPEGDEGMPMGEGKVAMTFKPIKDIELEQTEAMLFQEAIQKFVMENPEITVKLIKTWMLDRDPLGRNAAKK